MLHTKLNMACKLTKALSKQRIKNIRRKKRMNIERERGGGRRRSRSELCN